MPKIKGVLGGFVNENARSLLSGQSSGGPKIRAPQLYKDRRSDNVLPGKCYCMVMHEHAAMLG